MLRFIVRRWARFSLIWRNEKEASVNEWMARVQQSKAAAERKEIARMTADADAHEARIKQMAEMEEKGYWECENGHESASDVSGGVDVLTAKCKCGKPARFISRATMTGQEKYESDKDRKESETMLANARAEITTKEDNAKMQEATVDYFLKRAASARKEAEAIRNV